MNKRTDLFRMLLFVCALTMLVSACDDDDDDDNVVVPTVVTPVNDSITFITNMTGDKEVPMVATSGAGTFSGKFHNQTKRITFSITWTLGVPTDSVVGMHFHSPADTTQSAPITIPITGFPTTSTGSFSSITPVLTAQQEADLRANKMYFNVHSGTYRTGELRGNLKK